MFTATDFAMINRRDEDHLRCAIERALTLYSFNVKDYAALHRQWSINGESHAGIILGAQQRFTIGEQMRRLLRVIANRSAEEMENRLEYLSSWGNR